MTTPVTTPHPARPRLEGKRVVVTGGARGIGESIARRFSSEGATVAILDRLEREGAELAEEIGGHFVSVDLSNPASIVRAMDDAISRLGAVDVLVNNAGILKKAALLDITVDDWDTVFDINVRAMLVTTQVAARSMRDAGSPGTIVNLASMAGKTGGAGQAHYAASKSAVIALTRVSALELGPLGITANCICPGYVLTEMGAAGRTEADVAEWSTYSPLGRLGETSDVSGVAAFLASADAHYLTGLAVDVSGGMTTC
jgi:3-oxoacyl-[acyl-carrier protein] reductase